MITIYHSREWDGLVERGWVTKTVEEANGVRVAFMIYVPQRKRLFL